MALIRDPNCLTPIMTSNNIPSGLCFAIPSTGTEWKAFNGIFVNTDYWLLSATTYKFGYDFISSNKIATYYNLYLRSAYKPNAPKNWTFEGWDGTKWVILDTRTNQTSWVDDIKNTYNISNTTSYSKYQINVTENNGSGNSALIEFEICGISSPKGRPHTI